MDEYERRKALGDWGEEKAIELLKRSGSGFEKVTDINATRANHPFGDIYAEVGEARFVIGVKTRCKYQVSGALNREYNVRKKGVYIESIASRYNADLGWIAIQVVPELHSFNAYFGTIALIENRGERFSIPMRPEQIIRYKRLGRADEFDQSIRLEWSNGGYPRALAKRQL